ncbi:TetR/AcrR family transcriptional regulator [Nocardioides fonticola]|uniref:TetR/AcrR family transcriptional regulator n=1 Tax=Nocardioides fonticola TaxID=450363 RepID=A0ABP7XBM0_9ACTN
MSVDQHTTDSTSRPRVEGDREQEIFEATLEVLAEAGYDRLTMDAVAAAAKASKATLYRRWRSKADLVVAALQHHKGSHLMLSPTGTLRGDLIDLFCGPAGPLAARQVDFFASVVTALHRDPEFATRFRAQVLAPKIAASRAIYERAVARGEIRDDVDLDLVAPMLAGVVLHRVLVLGEPPTRELVERVIDQLVLPAVRTAPPSLPAPTDREVPS